jgi:hypothetical protein
MARIRANEPLIETAAEQVVRISVMKHPKNVFIRVHPEPKYAANITIVEYAEEAWSAPSATSSPRSPARPQRLTLRPTRQRRPSRSKARFQAWVDEQDARTSEAIATLTANWDERVATIKTEWAEYKTQTAQADATEKAAKAEAYAGAAVKFAADTQHHAEEAIVQAALARAEARDA